MTSAESIALLEEKLVKEGGVRRERQKEREVKKQLYKEKEKKQKAQERQAKQAEKQKRAEHKRAAGLKRNSLSDGSRQRVDVANDDNQDTGLQHHKMSKSVLHVLVCLKVIKIQQSGQNILMRIVRCEVMQNVYNKAYICVVTCLTHMYVC